MSATISETRFAHVDGYQELAADRSSKVGSSRVIVSTTSVTQAYYTAGVDGDVRRWSGEGDTFVEHAPEDMRVGDRVTALAVNVRPPDD